MVWAVMDGAAGAIGEYFGVLAHGKVRGVRPSVDWAWGAAGRGAGNDCKPASLSRLTLSRRRKEGKDGGEGDARCGV